MSRLEIESGAFQSLSKTNVAADVRRRICGQVVQFLSLQPVHNSFFIRRGEMGNLPKGIPKEAGVRLLRMRKAVSRMRAFISKGEVNVVVETPKGSRVKYAFDPESGFFELRRALPEGMMFPF